MNERVNAIPREARAFQHQRAGVVTRAAAGAVDVALVVMALAATSLALGAIKFLLLRGAFELPRPAAWIDVGVGSVVMTVYLAASWHGSGRTYGAFLMGLRLVDHQGRSPGWAAALLRALLTVVFPLGLLWVVFSQTNRSIQDVVFRTSVIYDWDVRRP